MAKRLLCFILMLALALSALSGCSKGEEEDEKLKIVCTIFPQYDWMRNIIGEIDGVELTLLISNGNDMHSYEPSAADIMKIADCDMIVYLGKDIDGWVSEAIERSGREDVKKVALAECEGVTLRNISSASHTHDHGEHDEHDDHDLVLLLQISHCTFPYEFCNLLHGGISLALFHHLTEEDVRKGQGDDRCHRHEIE